MTAPSTASPVVATLTRQLLTALRAERALHDHLLRLTVEEHSAITGPTRLALADSPLPLEVIITEKEQYIARLTAIEQTRSTLSRVLATALGLPRSARLDCHA